MLTADPNLLIDFHLYNAGSRRKRVPSLHVDPEYNCFETFNLKNHILTYFCMCPKQPFELSKSDIIYDKTGEKHLRFRNLKKERELLHRSTCS